MKLLKSLTVAFLFLISPSAEATISGTYVGSGPDIAVILQIVETNGGQLSGRYEQQKVVAGNRIEPLNASVTGSSDGQTVILQVRPTEVLTGTYVLSGMISGSVLQVNGGGYGQTFHLNLTKGTEEDFKRRVVDLSASANRASATIGLETELATAESTLEAMSKFSADPEPHPSAFIPYEQRYRTLTQQMQLALGRQMVSRFIQSPARGQIGVAINQAFIESDQIHANVLAQRAELERKVTSTVDKVAPIAKRCGDPTMQTNIAAPALEKLKLECTRIPPVAKQFGTDLKKIRLSFDQIEAVWREEHEKQQAIVRSADLAAR